MSVLQLQGLYDMTHLSSLAEPFTWAAIDSSPNNRSPGADGYANDLLCLSQEFLNNTIDLIAINTVFITTLLPKKEVSFEIKDFRPISLLHSVPKLATKMSVRLQRKS